MTESPVMRGLLSLFISMLIVTPDLNRNSRNHLKTAGKDAAPNSELLQIKRRIPRMKDASDFSSSLVFFLLAVRICCR